MPYLSETRRSVINTFSAYLNNAKKGNSKSKDCHKHAASKLYDLMRLYDHGMITNTGQSF